MTFKEFKVAKGKIIRERFDYFTGDALEHAIRRNQFEQNKLRRLIELGTKLPDSKTISLQTRRWKRMLERMQSKQTQLQALDAELKANALTVTRPLLQIRGLGTFPSGSSEGRGRSIA